MLINKLLKIEENWVVFFDLFSKNGNGDSIRPIAEELKKLRPDMKFFFCTSKKRKNKHIDLADEIIKENSLKFKYVCKKAKYIISPMGFPKVKKRNEQVFVQTWHGSPLKKLYLSKDMNSRKYQHTASIIANADIFCSQGEIHNQNLREAFGLKKEQIFNTGLPRNDILFKNTDEFKLKLKKELNIPLNKKVIFYCPTWRRYDYKAEIPFNIDLLRENFSDEYVFLIRSHVGLHTWVDKENNPVDIFDNKFVFNGGDYGEVTHLYLISDILITDYSSSLFDYSITQKPIILYAYDKDEYQKEFGFYFDYENFAPCDICKNFESLVKSIKNIGNFYDKYSQKYADFKQLYLESENGNATSQVINLMLEKGK